MLHGLVTSIALLGFLVVAVFLATNHWGMAIRITNYIYFLLVARSFLFLLKKNEKK